MTFEHSVKVAFLDVGQGDSIVVTVPNTGEAVIIDCPEADTVIEYLRTLLSCNWKGPMMNFLPGAGRALPRAPGTPGFVPANQRAA
jgi:hypothetical protein